MTTLTRTRRDGGLAPVLTVSGDLGTVEFLPLGYASMLDLHGTRPSLRVAEPATRCFRFPACYHEVLCGAADLCETWHDGGDDAVFAAMEAMYRKYLEG